METQTHYQIQPNCETDEGSQYGIIENENITSFNFSNLTISGSLFSLTTFKDVTFDSCVFFGSHIKNCEFTGCTFKNCTFEFSHIYDCSFHATLFENCRWELTPIKKSLFSSSFINRATSQNVNQHGSLIENCFMAIPLKKVI